MADYADNKGIRLLFRPSYCRVAETVADAIDIVRNVDRPNFLLAPSVALLLNDEQTLESNLAALRQAGVANLIVAAPQDDLHNQIWNMNTPVYKYAKPELVWKILKAFPDSRLIMDGLYSSPNDECLDTKVLDLSGN